MSANLKNIHDKGGNKIAIIELDELNHIPQNPAEGLNCLDLGHIASSALEVKTKKTAFKNEAGQMVAADFEHEGITSGILMETDKMKMDYLAFGVRGKKHLEYKYLGIKGGCYQESFKVVEVTPQMKISAPGGTKSMPYESTAVISSTDVIIDSPSLIAIERALGIEIKTDGPVTIPGNTEHALVETQLR